MPPTAPRSRLAARTLLVFFAVLPSALGFTGAKWLCHSVAEVFPAAHAVLAETAESRAVDRSPAHEPGRSHDETACDICRASCAEHNAPIVPRAPVAVRQFALRRESPIANLAFVRDGDLAQPSTRAPPRIRA